MAKNKLTKPTNLMPRSFGGEKNNFSEDLIENGFEANVQETYNGDNLNYQLNATGKELEYVENVIDYMTEMPTNNVITVNANNQFEYADLSQRAIDSAVVHKTGDETINGVKTFNERIIGDISGNANTATNDIDGNPIKTTYMKNLIAGDNITITDGKISVIDVLNNKDITNCILEAPSGVFKLNAEGKYCVPKGTRFLSANGIDINGNIKNLDITLTSDVVFSTFSTENSDYTILFLSSIDGGATWQYGYRYYPTQWYEQNTQPNTTDGTWYNSQDKKWRNIQTQDGTGQWYDCNMIPIALVSLKNYLVDKVYKIFEPIELLTNSTRLSNANAVNYANATTIPFNTIFTAPTDGKVFVYSNIDVSANYLTPESKCDCAGFINPIISGVDNVITKTASQEFRNVGTHTFNAPNTGWYKFILVGGGGTGGRGSGVTASGQTYANGGSGGSGAAFMGEIYLTAGNHTITVGGANGATSVDGLVVAGNGTAGGGNTGLLAGGYAGAGGTVSITGQVQNVTMQSNGNAGQAFTGDASGQRNVPGGASLYNGWGSGAGSNGSPATGYAYVEYSYQETVSSRTVTGTVCYSNFTNARWDGGGNTVGAAQNTSSWIDIEKGQNIYFTTTISLGLQSIPEFICYFYPNKREVN